MPRKGSVTKRQILPDPKFHDVLVAKFINGIMRKGKKSIAESVMYGALDIASQKVNDEPVAVLRKAVENIKPILEVKSRRVGGATYQVPTEVPGHRRQALAIRWLINYAKARSEDTMRERLAGELMDAYNSRGAAYKKREDVHRMAEANKAFAHYRW